MTPGCHTAYKASSLVSRDACLKGHPVKASLFLFIVYIFYAILHSKRQLSHLA
jgi:hypothetical protein